MIIILLETIQRALTVVIIGGVFLMGALLMHENYENRELKKEIIRLEEIIKDYTEGKN